MKSKICMINEILKNITDPDAKDFVEFMKCTGLRKMECLNLEWSDIDYAKKVISVVGKSAIPRIVQIKAKPIRMLQRRQKMTKSKRVFQKSLTIVKISRFFRKAAKIAGVTSISLHDLRHFYFSRIDEFLKDLFLEKIKNATGLNTNQITEGMKGIATSEYPDVWEDIELVIKTPMKELPLIMADLEYDLSKIVLVKRMKNE